MYFQKSCLTWKLLDAVQWEEWKNKTIVGGQEVVLDFSDSQKTTSPTAFFCIPIIIALEILKL